MKHIFTLTPLALVLMLAACNTSKNNPEIIDWDHPLYQLNADGDTASVWQYETIEQGRTVTRIDLPGILDEGSEMLIYDRDDRLVGTASTVNSGNIHNSNMNYTYTGKVRTGEGTQSTDGSPSYYSIKEVTYFLDDEFKYDTLTQQFTAELDWLEPDEEEYVVDGEPERPMNYYMRKRYEETPNGYRLVESQTFTSFGIYPDEVNIEYSYKMVYAYNDKGQLVSEKLYTKDGEPGYETTYTYEGNKRIEHQGDSQYTTYYKVDQ